MVEIERPRIVRRVIEEVRESKIWQIKQGDLILIERQGSRSTVVLGRFKEKYGPSARDRSKSGLGGILLELPAYRIGTLGVYGQEFPIISQFNNENDAHRSLDSIDEISVGPEEIAKRLPQIHPAYEAYIPFIRKLE